MISISYLCFFAVNLKKLWKQEERKLMDMELFSMKPSRASFHVQVTSLSLFLTIYFLEKEPLLKYIGIKNAVFDRFFF